MAEDNLNMRTNFIFIIFIFLFSKVAISSDTAVYLVLSKQMGLLTNTEVIANNVANADTTGFKEQILIEKQYKVSHGSAKDTIYVKDIATFKKMENGDLVTTSNPLDLAIQGEGLFIIDTANGNRYSRAGNFVLNLRRQLVTVNGDPVLNSGGGQITFPEDSSDIQIRQDGTIYVGSTEVTKIGIAQFENYALMENEGKNLLKHRNNESPDKPDTKKYRIVQGFLENSNVNRVKQLTLLMETQRDVSLVTSFISSYNELDNQTITKLTKF